MMMEMEDKALYEATVIRPQTEMQSGKYLMCLRTEERGARSVVKDGRLLGQSKRTQSQTLLEAQAQTQPKTAPSCFPGARSLPLLALSSHSELPRGLFLTIKCVLGSCDASSQPLRGRVPTLRP